MADFQKRKRARGATETLTLPISPETLERYRRIQSELDRKGYESIHIATRARIDQLLDEAEKLLSSAG